MNTETTPVKITTLYGPLYIAVARADLYEYHSTERGDVSELRPVVRVASDPTFEADPNAEDHWTIRGRAYAVHYKIYFEDRPVYQGECWHRDTPAPHNGGFRNDRRGPVESLTKTWDLMWEEVVRALDTFDAQTPGWADLSRYLYHTGQQDSHEFQAARLRREAAEYDIKAQTHIDASDVIAPAIPDAVLALIKES